MKNVDSVDKKIRLHVLCSLILIYTVYITSHVVNSWERDKTVYSVWVIQVLELCSQPFNHASSMPSPFPEVPRKINSQPCCSTCEICTTLSMATLMSSGSQCKTFYCLPDSTFSVVLSKLKAFAYNKFNVTQKIKFVFHKIEIIIGN